MTRRIVAAAALAASLGGLALTPAVAHATHGDKNLICIGGDNQKRPGYGTMACISDPTQGWDN
jgi:hypothetical protein